MNELGPVHSLRFSRHAVAMARDRFDLSTDEQAEAFITSEYAAARITYRSKRYPDQIKVQGDVVCLAYHPASHKIITMFVSGHIGERNRR